MLSEQAPLGPDAPEGFAKLPPGTEMKVLTNIDVCGKEQENDVLSPCLP